jgi:hypothetical protein
VYLTCIEEIEVYLQANDPFCKLEESRKLKKKDHKKLLSRGIVISSRLLFSYFTIDWFPSFGRPRRCQEGWGTQSMSGGFDKK